MKARTILGLLLMASGLGTYTVLAQRQDGFPHREHEGLFPLCAGCHVMEASRAAWYPAPQLCARCHDGQQEERVTWAVPAPEPSNLRFDHAAHQRAAAREPQPLDCGTCHSAAGGTGRMNVTEAQPSVCFNCHAHTASNHLTDAPCAECHVPLVRSTLTTDRISALPEPPDHDREDFLFHHDRAEAAANCEFCHVREQCAACHVNAQNVPAITRLAAAPPTLRVPPMESRHPEPASHDRPDFATNHGDVTRTESCATCHTRESCMTCHAGRLPREIEALTPASQSTTQGVSIERSIPVSHAAPGFMIHHGNLAATDPAECSTCHTRQSCEECHDAPDQAEFHPPDFMLSHSAAAYTGRLECSNCHDPRVFCRECHAQGGQTSSGRLASSVFHDAEPLWLLRHGGAARRGLEACASCHAQRDCLQCHSTLGAFKISPHTSDFDARRTQQRNPIICKACHIGDPINR